MIGVVTLDFAGKGRAVAAVYSGSQQSNAAQLIDGCGRTRCHGTSSLFLTPTDPSPCF